ncbi:hypothetical protein [Streptomyces sp. NPDC001068]|uniref:hypothetical protein n=1 Tax=Streptomyces sp. NPDC001068 TaxID=3364544 RepID=UPI0036A02296
MCNRHYIRWRRTGDPLGVLQPGRPPQSVEDVVARALAIPANANGCRITTGVFATARGGYPQVSMGNKRVRVHRLMLEQALGRPIGPGLEACHTCDTPACCEPSHLFEGTSAANQGDKVAKSRQAWGTQVNTAKLTPDQVKAIREAYRSGARYPSPHSSRSLGEQYGVHHSTIREAANGGNWALLS